MAEFSIGDRASHDTPQYEIASDKTDHVAARKGDALTRLS